MVQTTAIHQPFHFQLLPLNAAFQQAINLEIIECTHGEQALHEQNLMSLGTETELPEICDDIDVTLTILEGQGSLTLNEEIIPLEPGRFIFIPAQMPHTLRTHTSLMFLLCRSESDPSLADTAWAITL